MSILGFGLWASSGPFPLSAHYGLYKRGRDPPTNSSRHLKKQRTILHLKWLLKEEQGGRPTAATAAAPPRAAAVPAAVSAASPCLVRWFSSCSLPAAAAVAAASGRRCRRRRQIAAPTPPSPSPAIPSFSSGEISSLSGKLLHLPAASPSLSPFPRWTTFRSGFSPLRSFQRYSSPATLHRRRSLPSRPHFPLLCRSPIYRVILQKFPRPKFPHSLIISIANSPISHFPSRRAPLDATFIETPPPRDQIITSSP